MTLTFGKNSIDVQSTFKYNTKDMNLSLNNQSNLKGNKHSEEITTCHIKGRDPHHFVGSNLRQTNRGVVTSPPTLNFRNSYESQWLTNEGRKYSRCISYICCGLVVLFLPKLLPKFQPLFFQRSPSTVTKRKKYIGEFQGEKWEGIGSIPKFKTPDLSPIWDDTLFLKFQPFPEEKREENACLLLCCCDCTSWREAGRNKQNFAAYSLCSWLLRVF